jgi:transcriptional regulator with XRE-family HTH domain
VVGASRELPVRYVRFFRALGHRIRSYRTERQLSQEDMISYGFSVRHWQMIEAGRPTTVFTLLRVCDTFEIPPNELLAGLTHHLHRGKNKQE